MYTAAYVDEQISIMKNNGTPLQNVAWKAAVMCEGWPYVFGDRGQYCVPSNRRVAYNRTAEGKDKDNIKNKCKNFDGNGSCAGCEFYPGGKTREFDCRGFTYWVLLQVFGWELSGVGCTSQWNKKSNWKAKGKISDGIPADTLVCLFYSRDNKEKTWEHTGLGFNDETVECSGTVIHKTSRNKKWTHWAVPACINGDVPTPTPPTPTKPTLRYGSSGEYVKELQTKLVGRGYSVGTYGADGKFGRATEQAVKEFQRDAGLTVDGICGPNTWAALDGSSDTGLYTVHIPFMPLPKAQAIANQYPGAYLTPEGGN